MESKDRMKKKIVLKGLKLMIQGLPLAGAVGTVFLPLHHLGGQFAVLVVLIWVQVFFIFEVFQVGK
jgi:hypothetical protein